MFSPIEIPTRSPWVTQILVIRALLKREIVTRFGEYKLGFLWMLLEPLISVIILGLIMAPILGRAVPEIPYAFFLLNGKILLSLFTKTMKAGVNAIQANQGLLVYRTVRPLDPFLARYIFELLSNTFSFVLFCLIGMWIGIDISLANLGLLVACAMTTWVAGCGAGLSFGVAAAHFKEVEKVVMILQSPLIFISAVLFPITVLPNRAQELLLHNPLVHTIELSRVALFPDYNPGPTILIYPVQVALLTLGCGLIVFHKNRNFLAQR